EELRTGIDQLREALARRLAALFVLRFDGLRPATLANFLLLILNLREQIDHPAGVLLKFGGLRVYIRLQNRAGHTQILANEIGSAKRYRLPRWGAACCVPTDGLARR